MYCQQIHASGSSSNTYNSSWFEQSSEAQNHHVLFRGSWAGVFAHNSCHGGQVLLFLSLPALLIMNLIVINNNLFAMALNEDTYKLLIVANYCKLFINCFLVPVPAPKAATA
jgi:hypothetical protein